MLARPIASKELKHTDRTALYSIDKKLVDAKHVKLIDVAKLPLQLQRLKTLLMQRAREIQFLKSGFDSIPN